MSTPLDPRLSEFATQEQADRYDQWLRAKVTAALKDPRPAIAHDEAMARIRRTIADVAASQKLA